MSNEATARIKINKLLESAGLRFFDDASGKANIRLEATTKIAFGDLNALGDNTAAHLLPFSVPQSR